MSLDSPWSSRIRNTTNAANRKLDFIAITDHNTMSQNPNDNFQGLMNGGLAFESFRTSEPGSPIYDNGMSLWTIQDLAAQVQNDTLPQVSWVLPTRALSEHPDGASSPADGAFLVSEVLAALTSNAEVWSKTILFITCDENDGLFDHVLPPAVPSINLDGTMAGKTTLSTLTPDDVTREYFSDPTGSTYVYFNSIPSEFDGAPKDTISGTVGPLGMGPRVPMLVVSPWSRGGWVNSEVFDHTSGLSSSSSASASPFLRSIRGAVRSRAI